MQNNKHFPAHQSISNLEKLRIYSKKQARLSIVLGPDDSLSWNSSRASDEAVNESLSTLQSTTGGKIKNHQPAITSMKPQKSHFEFGASLGKGRYGCVYIARHKLTGFLYAIKTIKRQYILEQNLLNQLIRQIKIQSYCQHPNLVKLYGYFIDQTDFYLIIQLVTQGNLFKKIKQHRHSQRPEQPLFPESKVASIVKQICEGVRYLHTLKIIHRDIKPQNILVERDLVKICDFGWAVCAQSKLRNTVCGTPLYISPQLLKGQSYGDKIDLWAIGILAWQLFYGKIPFKITCEKDLVKIIEQQIVFPQLPRISQTFNHFLKKILCKNPTQRLKITNIVEHNFLQV